ncbi:MAG: oxidoreductase family protein, partial [uncultured bacterium]
MQALVVGYGSIGKRHAYILQSLGCQVVLVTSQQVAEFTCYASIVEALRNESIQYVIIANPTALHYEALLLL